jgi:hypothetical protein
LSYRDRTTIPDVKVDNRKRSRAELEKRILSILSLHKGGMGILKIGRTLGVSSGTVQGVLRPFAASAGA